MENFTHLSGFLGGLLIGLAVTMLLLLNGRIAGVSGIFGGLLNTRGRERGWRAAFVAGLLIGALAYMLAAGGTIPMTIAASVPALLLGGFLVGFGTRLGSGCTSGHGLCGIARLSKRSIVATVVFFGVASLTVFLARHGLG